MTHFKPWKILHLDLRMAMPFLPSVPGIGGLFVVFWRHRIPLGHCWFRAKQLPMLPAELREHALAAIAPAVARYLLGRPFEASTSNRSSEAYDLDFKAMAELNRPLGGLKERLALPPADAADPSVSVVVCTRERPDQLKRCLDSFQNLSRSPQDILVVDNAPRSDSTRRVVSRFPDIRYIREPKAGLDVARNCGIHHTSGSIIAFTDDDATVHPDWIARIREGFKDPDIMAVTGLVLPAELETEAQFLFETYWGFGRGYLPKVFSSRSFEIARSRGVPVWEIGAGANMAFRREIFDEVALFDERLDVGAAGCSGDSEMWYRILARGWKCLYQPTAVAYHYHRRDMPDLHHQIHGYMRGHVAALLIQFERHRHWGNLRRILVSLPWYYAGLTLKGSISGFSGREQTLNAELLGALLGVKYYILNRHYRSSSPNTT